MEPRMGSRTREEMVRTSRRKGGEDRAVVTTTSSHIGANGRMIIVVFSHFDQYHEND